VNLNSSIYNYCEKYIYIL